MSHTKSLHNYKGVNLGASTILGQKKPEQINNPEQSAPRGAVWSGQYQIAFYIILDQLEDSILEVMPFKSFFL